MSDHARDIKDAEERLRISEERLRLAEAASGIGIFELDLASDRLECTPQVAVLFGFGSEIPGATLADWEKVIFVDDVPKVRTAIETGSRTGTYHAEFRVTHPDGSLHWLSGTGQIVRDEKHQALLRGACYEITERKVLEARLLALTETLESRVAERTRQLEASATKLEETERRFRLLVEGVTDYAIFMLDGSGNVINWNKGAQRIKGYNAEEIIGRHFSLFYTEQDRRIGRPQQVLAEATQTGRCEQEGWRVRKDGSLFWAGIVVNAIRDPAGQLLGFAKVTRDLTERRAAEERLRQAQKMEALGQLVGGVAHDFNNLLTAISGNIQTLQRRLPKDGDGDLQRLARAALHAAERAALMTKRLLAYSRHQPLEPKPISVNSLISGMSEILRQTLGESCPDRDGTCRRRVDNLCGCQPARKRAAQPRRQFTRRYAPGR